MILHLTLNLVRYASGATIQVLLFGVLAINLKKVAPSAHTVCEIVNARWGRTAHKTFIFFCFCANIIVTAMLLLGGAATVEALTGVDYRLAAFLIPWYVIVVDCLNAVARFFDASSLSNRESNTICFNQGCDSLHSLRWTPSYLLGQLHSHHNHLYCAHPHGFHRLHQGLFLGHHLHLLGSHRQLHRGGVSTDLLHGQLCRIDFL